MNPPLTNRRTLPNVIKIFLPRNHIAYIILSRRRRIWFSFWRRPRDASLALSL